MRRDEKRRMRIMLGLAVVMACILIFAKNEPESVETTRVKVEMKNPEESSGAAILAAPLPVETPHPEEKVYSFFQGPKCWEEQRVWSGKWGNEYYDGANFGAFGCGFCCMANIYSTMTEYKCTPIQIYEHAKEITAYGGGGAISWGWMRQTMSNLGFEVRLGEKPATYREFEKIVAENPATLVLVSSYNDDSYWKNTPGHYVTLFLYDDDAKTAFLTDSGDPNHNRQRVRLRTIYKALKTSSDFQYMTVVSYQESKDNWKHKKATGSWIRPESKTVGQEEK